MPQFSEYRKMFRAQDVLGGEIVNLSRRGTTSWLCHEGSSLGTSRVARTPDAHSWRTPVLGAHTWSTFRTLLAQDPASELLGNKCLAAVESVAWD